MTIPLLESHRRDLRPALLSAVLALALYAITLGGTYVFDDREILLNDPRLTPSRWRELWTKDYFNGGPDNLYRPLVSMTYALQVWVHGAGADRAWAFHLMNWLLYAAVAAAVAELARRLTNSRVALIAGLLFAAHPVHAEAVANIVGRAELMCALGIVCAMILFLRGPLDMRRMLAIWVCFVVALLSKEQGMLLPLMLLAEIPFRRIGQAPRSEEMSSAVAPAAPEILGYAHGQTSRNQRRFSPPALWLVLLICWTLAASIVLREQVLHLKFWWYRGFLDWTMNPIIVSSGRDRWLMPLVFLGRYTMLLLAPVRLSIDYGADVIGPVVRLTDPWLYVGIGAVATYVVALAAALLCRARVVLFCLFGVAIFYGLVGNIVTIIGTNVAERLMFIPSIFVCLLAAMGLARLPKTPRVIAVTILVTLASLRTVTYAALWNHPRRLFEHNLAEQPRSIRLHLLLAEELVRQHDLPRAANVLARGRDVLPEYWRTWLRSAQVALEMDDLDAAERFYRQAVKLWPPLADSSLGAQIATRRRATSRP